MIKKFNLRLDGWTVESVTVLVFKTLTRSTWSRKIAWLDRLQLNWVLYDCVQERLSKKLKQKKNQTKWELKAVRITHNLLWNSSWTVIHLECMLQENNDNKDIWTIWKKNCFENILFQRLDQCFSTFFISRHPSSL
jgi:hypothetical protein